MQNYLCFLQKQFPTIFSSAVGGLERVHSLAKHQSYTACAAYSHPLNKIELKTYNSETKLSLEEPGRMPNCAHLVLRQTERESLITQTS